MFSRRWFLSLLGSAAVAPLLPAEPKVIGTWVDYGSAAPETIKSVALTSAGSGYASTPALTFCGIPLEFDEYCPPNTIYLNTSPECLVAPPGTILHPDTVVRLKRVIDEFGCHVAWTEQVKLVDGSNNRDSFVRFFDREKS